MAVKKEVAYRGTVGQTERLMAKITAFLLTHPDSTRTTLRHECAATSNHKLFPRALQSLIDCEIITETVWEYTWPRSRTYKMRERREE